MKEACSELNLGKIKELWLNDGIKLTKQYQDYLKENLLIKINSISNHPVTVLMILKSKANEIIDDLQLSSFEKEYLKSFESTLIEILQKDYVTRHALIHKVLVPNFAKHLQTLEDEKVRGACQKGRLDVLQPFIQTESLSEDNKKVLSNRLGIIIRDIYKGKSENQLSPEKKAGKFIEQTGLKNFRHHEQIETELTKIFKAKENLDNALFGKAIKKIVDFILEKVLGKPSNKSIIREGKKEVFENLLHVSLPKPDKKDRKGQGRH